MPTWIVPTWPDWGNPQGLQQPGAGACVGPWMPEPSAVQDWLVTMFVKLTLYSGRCELPERICDCVQSQKQPRAKNCPTSWEPSHIASRSVNMAVVEVPSVML